MYERKQNGEDFFSSLAVTYSRFGNCPANVLVTEQPQYSVVVCIFSTLQNAETPLIPNGLRFIYTCLLSLALPCIFHSARHTFSTIMCRKGIPREDIIIATGHEDTQMLDKIYAHLTAKDKSRKVTNAFKKKLGDGIFDMGVQPEPDENEQRSVPTAPVKPKQKADVFNHVFAGDLLLKLSRLKNKGIDITRLPDTEEAVKILKDVGRIDEIDKDKYKDNTRLRDKVARIASVVWFIAFKRNDAVLIQMFQNNITELGLRNIFLNGEIMREARLESLMNGDEKVLKFVEVLNIRSMEELEEYKKRYKE